MKRRDFIKDSGVSALALGTARHTFEPETFGSARSPISLPQEESKGPFWPDGARMVISISMQMEAGAQPSSGAEDRKSTRLNSSHANISYAVFCLKKKKKIYEHT